jgi:hypothetical protein
MKTLHIENVRCFRDRVQAPLAPITLLVGENSSGKSTFLALLRVAWDLAHGEDHPDFNEEPFELGSYDDIATYHGGQAKRAKSFSIGLALDSPSIPRSLRSAAQTPQEVKVLGTFGKVAGQPVLSTLRIEAGEQSFTFTCPENGGRISLRAESAKGPPFDLVLETRPFAARLGVRALLTALYDLRWMSREGGPGGTAAVEEKHAGKLDYLYGLLQGLLRGASRLQRPYAMAPIRSKPRRTYDPLRDTPTPEGGHVPMLLARLSNIEPERWESLVGPLRAFGRASGLFDSVEVRRFDQKEATPFQIRVSLAGQRAASNIVDVGYGVSQVLPLLVDSLTTGSASTFLVQQPEIHLHPRAQAELGSFLCLLRRQRKHRFVVETHSDHLIDRVRYEVRRGEFISAKDVQLIYFAREGAFVRMHPLTLDGAGNIGDAPEDYRQFFLDEQLRVLGVDEP